MKITWRKSNKPNRYIGETEKHIIYIEQYRNDIGHLEKCWFGTFQYKENLSHCFDAHVPFDTLRQGKHWFEVSINEEEL